MRNKTKKAKIKGFSTAIAFLCVMISVIIAFVCIVSFLTDKESQKNLEQQLNINNISISNVLENNIKLLTNLSKQLKYTNEDGFLPDEELFRQFEKINEFDHIILTDSKGVGVAENGVSYDFTTQFGYKMAQRGESYIDDPEPGIFNDTEVMVFVIPVIKDGITINVLYGAKSVENIENEINNSYSADNGYFYILSDKGVIISRSQNSTWQRNTTITSYISNLKNIRMKDIATISQIISTHDTKTIRVPVENGHYIVSFAPLKGNARWSIMFCTNQTKDIYSTKLVAVSICCVVIMVLLGLLLLLVYRRNEKLRKKEIQHISTTDSLTGIGNLTNFYVQARKLLAGSRQKYIIIRFDIRDFKQINDGYGYTTGDHLLKSIANFLTGNVAENETAARITTDNFVILKNTENADFINTFLKDLKAYIIDELGESMGKPMAFNVGVYNISDNDESVVTIMDRCNIALKASKTDIPNKIIYYNDSLVTNLVTERQLEQHMHEGLKNGEFQIYVQPKYMLQHNMLIGGEALIRWENPQLGFLAPDKFIPLFEHNGFIAEIDFYVLENIMQRLESMQHSKIKLFPISVNMSRVTLGTSDFISRLTNLLDKYNLPKGLIELEVTESVFVGDYGDLLTVLDKIHKLGCVIVMDDFGSGYSSLNLLKEVPFDVLKLDKLFLNEGTASKRTTVIMQSIIDMAKKIKVQVVCEGVETKAQVQFLTDIKCDVAQGFYFSRPVPIVKYEMLVEGLTDL